jgi:hypothetical protein
MAHHLPIPWPVVARRCLAMAGVLAGMMVAFAAAAAPDTAGRDPTEPPAAARRTETSAAPATAAADPVIRHIQTVGGRRFVFDGARRFGVGDHLGTLRIACIHDGGVSVRDDEGTRRFLPLHGHVRLRPAGAPASASASTPAPPPCPEAPASKRNPR